LGAVEFAYSPSQLKYLLALRESVDEARPTSDRAIAEALKMSRTTIWEWKHDPAFIAWLRAELKIEEDPNFDLAVRRHTALAIRGSVRSFEAIARLRAIVGVRVGVEVDHDGGAAGATYQVNLLVPRPDDLATERDATGVKERR
jgi:hypothetical protein